jgi:hypothetical protein
VSNFQQPGIGGDKFEAARHNGHLMLFFPTRFEENIPTRNGAADAVTAKIVDLDTGEVLDDAKVWGKAMVPQLKGAVPDGMVLGRLAQGEGKAGNNPPWILHPHTEQDVARAEAYLAANPRNQFQNGPAPAAAPAPAQQQGGWGAPAPAAAPAQGGWGAPAPAPAPQPAPAAGGWGAPAAPAQGGWGAPAPAPAPEPEPTTYEEFLAAFKRKGVPDAQVATLQSPEQAQQLWALVKDSPNVA